MLNIESTGKQFESSTLDLALVALDELAKRKINENLNYVDSDISVFCDAIISENDDLQIELIDDLISGGISLAVIYEKFIPEIAERLGNLWKESKVTFVEVNIGAQRLQRLSRIYENQYLGPMYISNLEPDILLILPNKEIHTLGLIMAAGIFKKNGANPFVAVGYSNIEIRKLIKSRNFELIGFSISNSDNLTDCLESALDIKKFTKGTVPIILGGQGVKDIPNNIDLSLFNLVTSVPKKALEFLPKKKLKLGN
jgi:hypothetical protein